MHPPSVTAEPPRSRATSVDTIPADVERNARSRQAIVCAVEPAARPGPARENNPQRSPGSGPGSDEEQALVAALASVLDRKPKRAAERSSPRDHDFDDWSHVPGLPAAPRRFVSVLGQATPEFDAGLEEDDEPPTTRAGDARWLAAARRNRWRHRLRDTAAWTATVLIGVTIVGVAAALLFNDASEFGVWLAGDLRAL